MAMTVTTARKECILPHRPVLIHSAVTILILGTLLHAGAAALGEHTPPAAGTPGERSGEDTWIQPNMFDLRGEDTTISLAPTETGDVVMAYNGEVWPEDEIEVSDGPFGSLLTITLEVIPDGGTHTLTLVVPTVNLPSEAGAEAPCSTVAILTMHRDSLIGPAGVEGQVEDYEVVELTGTAGFSPT